MLGNVKVELYLSIYAKKSDLELPAGVDTSKFSKRVDLVSLKSEIDKINICKLEITPFDLEN